MTVGLQRVERLLERQKILTYWAIGRHINRYLSSDSVAYGAITPFYEKLARDLDISSRTLQHCEQFFRYFPKLNPKDGLSWSHYRYLLVLPEEKERLAWINRIQNENLPANTLRLKLLSAYKEIEDVEDIKFSEPVRGKLYTYRILRAEGLEGVEVPWFVDCGFANRIEAPPSNAILDNKNIYTSVKTKNGYLLKVTDSKADELFTFKAKVRRVIDGDTLLVAVDEGFGIWTEQRLRLRGIDAPELDTLSGKKAKQWVENELAEVPFVIAKTYKSDKYDRYLVDIFYLKNENDPHRVAKDGELLNHALLLHGLVKVWKI